MSAIEKFTKIPRHLRPKRDVALRVLDTNPVRDSFGLVDAQQQASRCAGCCAAGCQNGCPLGNDIRTWLVEIADIRLSKNDLDRYGLNSDDLQKVGGYEEFGFDEAEGKDEAELRAMAKVTAEQMLKLTEHMNDENARQFFIDKMGSAIEIAFATNPMPEVTGKICPQEDLCESADGAKSAIRKGCTHANSNQGPVTIGSIEEFIGLIARKHDLFPDVKPAEQYEREESIGIVGSGPAAFAAAWRARKNGIQVTIYEASDRPGGLLQYGIPDDKLPKKIVDYYYGWLKGQGVEIVTNTKIGQDVSVQDLTEKHDEVVLATGAGKLNPLRCENGHLATSAMAFLEAGNRTVRGEDGIASTLNAKGKDVIVIGAGDTSMDAVRTAVRQAKADGASSVRVLYYRGLEDITASNDELAKVMEEIGEKNFIFFGNIKSVSQDGDRLAIKYARTTQIDPGTGGRKKVQDTDEILTIHADDLINATGFSVENPEETMGITGLQRVKGGFKTVTVHTVGGQVNPLYGLAGFFNDHSSPDESRTTEAQVTPLSVIGDLKTGADLVVRGLRAGRDLGDVLTTRFDTMKSDAEAFVASMTGANIPRLGHKPSEV